MPQVSAGRAGRSAAIQCAPKVELGCAQCNNITLSMGNSCSLSIGSALGCSQGLTSTLGYTLGHQGSSPSYGHSSSSSVLPSYSGLSYHKTVMIALCPHYLLAASIRHLSYNADRKAIRPPEIP